jgi:hypothetical protein
LANLVKYDSTTLFPFLQESALTSFLYLRRQTTYLRFNSLILSFGKCPASEAYTQISHSPF